MLVPHHLNPPPPSRGKGLYPPISGISYHWQLYTPPPLFGLSREIFPRLHEAKYTPLSRENGNAHATPLRIRVGGGGGAADKIFTDNFHNVT